MNKINHTEEMFVTEYIKNGRDGTLAYMMVRPRAEEGAAAVISNRLLKKPVVQAALQEVINKKLDEATSRREYLTNQAHEIGKDAYKKEKNGAALREVEVKAKLNKV
ncbi:MAG: terminase small subunit [Planctomycetota bacterium]|jgi:hypothetical protein